MQNSAGIEDRDAIDNRAPVISSPAPEVARSTESAAPVRTASDASSQPRRFGRLGRVARVAWQPLILLIFIAAGTSIFGGTDVYPLLVLAGIYGIATIGVSLSAGLGGQFSLGHATFIGIGAYATALSTTRWDLSPLLGLLIGIAGSLLVALVATPVLRLRGWYLAMATISIAFILQQVAVNLKSITGGNNGIYGIPPLSIGGLTVRSEKQFFVLAWVIVLVFFVLGRNLLDSRFGRAMLAIHKDEDAAVTLAIPSYRYKAGLWLLACVPPAIAGTLFAHYSAYISPGDFGLTTSLTLFVAVLLGGGRSIFGALVALVFLVCLPSFATTGVFTTDMIKGIGLIVVYMISPTGLAGLFGAPLRKLAQPGRRHA